MNPKQTFLILLGMMITHMCLPVCLQLRLNDGAKTPKRFLCIHHGQENPDNEVHSALISCTQAKQALSNRQ